MFPTNAFSLEDENFGIAIAARIPMITTTMSNSISVKPACFVMSCRLALRISEIL
jgi:hypothetical protein